MFSTLESSNSLHMTTEELDEVLSPSKVGAPPQSMFEGLIGGGFEYSDSLNILAEELEEILGPPKFEISEPSHMMFNGVVMSGYDQKDRVVDLKKILEKELLPRSPIGNGMYLQTIELTGRYGRMTKGFSNTLEYGKNGDIDMKFFTVQIILLISDDHGASKKVSFNIYANGKIRFSGGYIGFDVDPQPDAIRRFVIDSYTDKDEFFFNEIELTNASCQFQINGFFNCMITTARECSIGEHNVTSLVYEPELNPQMFVHIGDVKLSITKAGNIQILGATNASRLGEAYTVAKTFLRSLHNDKHIKITGVFNTKAVRKYTKKDPKAPKAPLGKTIDALKRIPKKHLTHIAKALGVVNFRVTKADSTRGAICGDLREMIFKKLSESD